MSGKKFMRKLAIGFGVLMLFLAFDIGVAWYLNPQAQTPVQAVRMEATHAAAEIIAKAMKSQIQKQEQAAPAAPPPAPVQPTAQPDQPQQEAQPQPEQKETRLDDIEAEGNILVYTITVKASGDMFDMVMRTLHSSLFPSGCTKPEYERLLEYGLGVTLDFRSQDGTKEDAITFTPEICGYTRIEQPKPQPAQPPPQPQGQQPTQPQEQQPTPPQGQQPAQPQEQQQPQPEQPRTPPPQQ